jgi:hypothetical protein
MNKTKLASSVCSVLAALLLALSLSPAAQAASTKAQIFLVQAAIPKTLTEKSLIAFGRRNANRILRETTDADLKSRKWKADMIVAFSQPVNDMEFQILFYDTHEGARRFVNDMAIMVNDRKQKTFVQKVTLPRPQFKPNRNMELVVTVRRAEVGRLKFGVVGEEIKRSGEVSFSDNER